MAQKISDKTNPCGFCKERDSIVLYNTYDIWGNHYSLHQCLQCKAVFLAPRPDKERLAQAYDTSYYGAKQEKFNSPFIERTLDFFRMSRARRLSSYLHKDAKILDIGCGNGKFLGYMTALGNFEIHGIELEGNSAKRAAKIPGIQLKTGQLTDTYYIPESFEAITLFHVFEHLEEPRETLRIINTILKPGGILMMSFPNINSLQSGIFKGKWLHLDPPRHLFFFRPWDITRILDELGYDVLRVKYSSLEQNPFGMTQSLLNVFYRKREILFERLKGNKTYAPEYGKLSLAWQKVFFLVLTPFFMLTDMLISSIKKGATVEFIFQKRI